MAFDRHINIVLGDCEEFRKFYTNKGINNREERRVLGLAIIRGNEVMSLTIEGPPPADTVRSKTQSAFIGSNTELTTNIGIAAPSTSSVSIGLRGLVKGLGGPAPEIMQPSQPISSITQMYHGARSLPGVSASGVSPPTSFPNVNTMELHA